MLSRKSEVGGERLVMATEESSDTGTAWQQTTSYPNLGVPSHMELFGKEVSKLLLQVGVCRFLGLCSVSDTHPIPVQMPALNSHSQAQM